MDSFDDEDTLVLAEEEENPPNEDDGEEPPSGIRDEYHLVHVLFFLIGLSQLLPFNFLITADDFWMYKFRNVNSTDPDAKPSALQTFFSSYLTIACNSPFLLVYLFSFTKRFQRISIDLKNDVSFIFAIAVFSLISCFVIINTDKFQWTFFELLMVLTFLLNASVIIIQANFAGIASLFPMKYMQAMVNGQAMSGLFAALAKIISLIGEEPLRYSVFIFFLFADLVLIVTYILYFWLRKRPFYKYYTCTSSSSNQDVGEPINFAISIKIFKKMWPFCLTLMFVFWITISIYPSLFVLITPSGGGGGHPKSLMKIPEKFILPITCFLIFCLGDFLGRYLGRYCLLSKNHGILLMIMAIIRVLFIPLFFYCNAQPRQHPVVFDSEIYFICFNLIFALLNGYLVLNAFINGPLSIPEEYRHISGYFLVSFLGLGLTLGSLTSPVILDIL